MDFTTRYANPAPLPAERLDEGAYTAALSKARQALDAGARLCVVGAGFIGAEVAAADESAGR